jgi:hypothetical protein
MTGGTARAAPARSFSPWMVVVQFEIEIVQY